MQNFQNTSVSISPLVLKTEICLWGCPFFVSSRWQLFSTSIYLFKGNNENTRTCEIISKLTINEPERRHWCRSGVFTFNFELISDIVLLFPLLTLNKDIPEGLVDMTGFISQDLSASLVIRKWWLDKLQTFLLSVFCLFC